ncbi:MAG: ATP-binding protein, partial [Rectinema sp.]|nr:ATP-binding protein [Rectinema sp.]
VLLGLAAIIAMISPFEFEKGIIYDTRSIIIGIAGFFGGPITGIIAAAIATTFRIYRGGIGVYAGSLSILWSAFISIIAFRVRYKSKAFLQKKHLYNDLISFAGCLLLGLIVHAGVILSQFALPPSRWQVTIPLILPAFLIAYPIAFALICLLFMDNERLIQSQQQLEESERRYKSLFQNHHTVMFIIDPQTGAIRDANPAAEAFYGWNRETLLTMRIQDINTMSPEEVKAEMQKASSRQKNVFNFRHRRANQPPCDVEVYSGPIEIEGRQLLYSIIHDISDRVRAERELEEFSRTLEMQVIERTKTLEEKSRQLEALNHEYEAFVYSVSHDLRAPLRALSGFSSILAEKLRTEHATEAGAESTHLLERIQANALRMQQLIDDMLMLSRIGTRELSPQKIDLSPIAREIAAEMVERHPDRRIIFTIDPTMPVQADPDLARMLLANLISNAVKFTVERDEARIQIGCTTYQGRRMCFIKDNGAGFDVFAAGDRLFSPFQRFHEASRFEGTGIGLSIVKRIVMRHGGNVYAESRPEQGAAFYFYFGPESEEWNNER